MIDRMTTLEALPVRLEIDVGRELLRGLGATYLLRVSETLFGWASSSASVLDALARSPQRA
jgi:hypothetical protein